jgi:hypothetical protein
MQGSCLCGKCIFEIKGETGLINKCHCTKCRKVSGTGSNAVFWVAPDCLKWVNGQDYAKSFVTPDGWSSNFCKECGSPLPRYIHDEEWIVPAGLIDGSPKTGILQHIWVQDKPDWEIIGDEAPQYQQVPTEPDSDEAL